MTKARQEYVDTHRKLEIAQYRLRVYAELIRREVSRTSIDPADAEFFADAFEKIAAGADAEAALQITPRRGERRTTPTEPPKRKRGSADPTPRQLGLARIRRFAELALSEMPTDENVENVAWLVASLKHIAKGAKANTIFGVAGKRGVRKALVASKREYARREVLGWIAAAVQPRESGGLGLTVDKACIEASEEFNIDVDVLKTYWGNNPEWREPSFPRPLFPFPEKVPKR